ncbi:MAG: enoyl-CoA hydratase/isomerase family protein [Planctomycetota bacterium]
MFEREERDGIATLRLAHGKASAFDLELLLGLEAALSDELQRSSRAVILTGTGSIFSAGVDLFRLLDGGSDYIDLFVPALDRVFSQLFAYPKPMVAAINGHAIAGGCILAACADRRIMAAGKGRIGVPELLVGVPFPKVAFEIMRFALPSRSLSQVIYKGITVRPEAALEIGLIDLVVSPDDLLETAHEEARELAEIPAISFQLSKKMTRGPTRNSFDSTEAERNEIVDAWKSEPVRAALSRYVERTFGRSS